MITEEMIEAGMDAWLERDPDNHFCIYTEDVVAMYKAMRALEPPLVNKPNWTTNNEPISTQTLPTREDHSDRR